MVLGGSGGRRSGRRREREERERESGGNPSCDLPLPIGAKKVRGEGVGGGGGGGEEGRCEGRWGGVVKVVEEGGREGEGACIHSGEV